MPDGTSGGIVNPFAATKPFVAEVRRPHALDPEVDR